MCQTAEAAMARNIAICMVRGCNTFNLLQFAKKVEKRKTGKQNKNHRSYAKDMPTSLISFDLLCRSKLLIKGVKGLITVAFTISSFSHLSFRIHAKSCKNDI